MGLVATDIHKDTRDAMFAATPPLEALAILIGMAVVEGMGYVKGKEEEGMQHEFIDIKGGFLPRTGYKGCVHGVTRRI